MWFGKLPTFTGESPYYLEIEKEYNKYMEEDHSTPFHTLCCIWQHGSSSSFSLLLVTSPSHTLLHMAAGLLPMAAWQQPLFLSSSRHFTLTHSLIALSNISLLYRHFLATFSSTWRGQ